MTKTKITTISYLILLIVGGIILFNISSNIQLIINNYTPQHPINNEYATLQTNAGIYSIIIFIILLTISFVLYFFTGKRNYIILSNLLYIGSILYVYITLNRNFHTAQNLEYSQQGEYWLTVFMGIFYIIGAILVSSIGYITIRNYTKRVDNSLK